MCDAHLVVAKTEQDGLACFFVPRWLEDGTKNPIHVQRLKDKVGNRSNSSSEVEFKEAWGIMIGEAGRGIPTIIEMANYTRLTCSVGSTAMVSLARTSEPPCFSVMPMPSQIDFFWLIGTSRSSYSVESNLSPILAHSSGSH